MDPQEAHAAFERARMQAAFQIHTFNQMLDEMTEDQLHAIASIFEGCMQSKGIAPQIYGQITAILRIKHNTCQCGQDHAAQFDVDKAIEKMTGAPATRPVVETPSAKCNCDASWCGGEHTSDCPVAKSPGRTLPDDDTPY